MRTIPREVQALKSTFRLSDRQQAVLIGTLLGDGALKQRGRYHRLHIKHSRAQLPLAKYKRNIFANITSMPIRLFSQSVNNKEYKFCEFVTLTHQEFSKVYRLMYPDNLKKINKQVVKNLKDPLSLAVWFMDDGSAENSGFAFHTQCFSLDGVTLLSETINKNFKLTTTIRRNKRGWIIYVPKRDVEHFVQLIEPYILPEFKYKLTPYSQRN